MTTPITLLYGNPPAGLISVPSDAVQTSPLVVDSAVLEELAEGSAASAIVYAPPGTLERRYVLALALRALVAGGELVALALKDKGGSRIAAELEALGCAVMEDSRSHHKVVTAERPTMLNIEDARAEGGVRHYPAHGLWTQPGVFSWDRVDAGTALLLEHLPTLTGTGADLGCGIGILSQAILKSAEVKQLSMIDIDRRAGEAAIRNVVDARAGFVWADVTRDQAANFLDFVVMNPPFHDTGIEDRELGVKFIHRAAAMLKKGGTLWCVANRHLPYEATLATQFVKVDVVAEANGFKVFRAER